MSDYPEQDLEDVCYVVVCVDEWGCAYPDEDLLDKVSSH